MHARRLVPHRLTAIALLAAGVAAQGCASDRYIGSIGRSGTYANRGFGIVANLAQGDLSARWVRVDPEDTSAKLRPVYREDPLDLDGDGLLRMDESIPRYVPVLRLMSKTSTGARIDVNVEILSGEAKDYTLDGLIASELAKITGGPVTPDMWEERQVGPDFPARVAETAAPASRIALVDQAGFVGEEGWVRRQVVKVRLHAPSGITPELRADFNELLRALSLARAGARQTVREEW